MTTTEATKPAYTCALHTAQVFELRIGSDHAIFTLASISPQYHKLSISSSYGGFAYAWDAPGESFMRFLARLNLHYVREKMVRGEPEDFDCEETVKQLRAKIKQARRKRLLEADAARREWLLVDELECWGSRSAFEDWGRDTKHFADEWFFCAVHSPGPRSHQFTGLYEKFWPAFAAELLKAAPTESTSAEAAQ